MKRDAGLEGGYQTSAIGECRIKVDLTRGELGRVVPALASVKHPIFYPGLECDDTISCGRRRLCTEADGNKCKRRVDRQVH